MNKHTTYSLDKLNLWPFSHLTFKCDLKQCRSWGGGSNSVDLDVTLTINLPEQMFQTALLFFENDNCTKLVWNTCINLQLMARPSSVYDHFIICPSIVSFQPTWTNNPNGTSTPQGEQLCQIILKCMHKCRSYGLNKLNSWPFHPLTFKCDLDLQLTWSRQIRAHAHYGLILITLAIKIIVVYLYTFKFFLCFILFFLIKWKFCFQSAEGWWS